MTKKTPLEQERSNYIPILPKVLQNLSFLHCQEEEIVEVDPLLRGYFPQTLKQPIVHFVQGEKEKNKLAHKIALLFSGGPAPGGHNVIAGLFDALKQENCQGSLIGFLGGAKGLLENRYIEITEALVAQYRNLGGFDMIGSGRTKIEKEEQFTKAAEICTLHKLTALVIVGGDDSNTNAALLAEDFLRKGIATKVIGVPKTIDGDLKNNFIECSFGFDTACKLYSEMIGNLAKDALSSQKYVHFVKLMGRSASHVTLECALQTHPNLFFIGEEVKRKGWTLANVVEQIADLIMERGKLNKFYGIVLIPEGLLEFIPECTSLLQALNITGKNIEKLSETDRALFLRLPLPLQEQLLYDRDPHGNVQLSHIETERLLVELTKQELAKRGFKGPFTPVYHFFGYEGRCSIPSNFDATYCYALGFSAYALIKAGCTGYIVALQNLVRDPLEWQLRGIPLVQMIHLEKRAGKLQCVIAKALVELEKEPFLTIDRERASWRLEDDYCSPGPMQFSVKGHNPTLSLLLESKGNVQYSTAT